MKYGELHIIDDHVETTAVEDVAEMLLFKRVLLVGEDPALLGDISDTLDLKFFDITTATTAADATRHLLREEFEVIVCDFATPNFPVETFLRALQTVRPGLSSRLISIINSAQDVNFTGALRIWKPVDTQMVVDAVESLLVRESRARNKPAAGAGTEKVKGGG